MTLTDTTSVIFSPASEDGPTPCASPAGPTTAPSGQAPVLANLSARPDAEARLTTNDTSGPLFTASSPSATLQRSLENRLRARLAGLGSPLFDLTWSTWDMPSGPPICRLRVSGRVTFGDDCGGWPTPAARDYRDISSTGKAYAASRKHHQPSAVTVAYERGFVTSQIPEVLSGLMGYPVQWVKCAASVMP